MPIPSIYINLEDDVTKITARLKRTTAKSLVLVCPKRCFLFSDSINLRLLKKQADLLNKEVFILTMDEKGRIFAEEAGFKLKFLPKSAAAKAVSDIRVSKPKNEESEEEKSIFASAFAEMKEAAISIAQKASPITETVLQTVQIKSPKVSSSHPKQHLKSVARAEVFDTIFAEPEIKLVNKHHEVEQPHEKDKKHTQRMVTGFVAISLVVLLLLNFIVLPKATVVVYAKTEPVTRDMEISISGNVQNIDTAKLAIPAKKIEESISLNDKFQSQGKKQVGNKASGTVRIFNFTGSHINLKAATTVFSLNGKNYNLVNDISALRPTTYKNQRTKEVDPASLAEPVEIMAAEGGEDSNLPAGTRLEISNQVFGSRPQLLYAKTDTEINGGTTRYLSVISQDDVDSAKNKLQQTAMNQIRQKLEAENLILLDKAFTLEQPQFTTDNTAGTQTPTFQAALTGKVVGLVYKKDDLTNLISERILQTLSTNKSLDDKSFDRTVYKIKNLDTNNQLAVLDVHFEGEAVYHIDLPDLAPQLVGKSKEQVYEVLKSKAEIDKVDITVAPSWQTRFPYFARQIKVGIAERQ